MKFLSKFLARKRVEAATDLERYQQLIRQAFTDGDLNEADGEELIAVGSRVGKSTEAIEAEIVRATTFNENVANYRRHIAADTKAYKANSDKWYGQQKEAEETIAKATRRLKEANDQLVFVNRQGTGIEEQQRNFAKLISDHRDLMPDVSKEDTAMCHHSYKSIFGNPVQPESFDRLAKLDGIPQNFGDTEAENVEDFPPAAYEPLTIPADLPAEARAQLMDASNSNGITIRTGAATTRTIA